MSAQYTKLIAENKNKKICAIGQVQVDLLFERLLSLEKSFRNF